MKLLSLGFDFVGKVDLAGRFLPLSQVKKGAAILVKNKFILSLLLRGINYMVTWKALLVAVEHFIVLTPILMVRS